MPGGEVREAMTGKRGEARIRERHAWTVVTAAILAGCSGLACRLFEPPFAHSTDAYSARPALEDAPFTNEPDPVLHGLDPQGEEADWSPAGTRLQGNDTATSSDAARTSSDAAPPDPAPESPESSIPAPSQENDAAPSPLREREMWTTRIVQHVVELRRRGRYDEAVEVLRAYHAQESPTLNEVEQRALTDLIRWLQLGARREEHLASGDLEAFSRTRSRLDELERRIAAVLPAPREATRRLAARCTEDAARARAADDMEAFVRASREILRLRPLAASEWLELGEALARLDELERAKFAYRAVAAESGEHRQAERRLRDLATTRRGEGPGGEAIRAGVLRLPGPEARPVEPSASPSPQLARLMEIVERFRSRHRIHELRRHSESEYAAAVRRASLLRGMNRREVVAAWGLFAAQEHFVSPEDGNTYDVLAYPGRRRVYLRDGLVFAWEQPGD